AFCGVLGLDPEVYWYEFVDKWGKVKKSEQERMFGEAARLAMEKPMDVTPCPGEKYRLAASLVIYLGRLSKKDGKTFYLSGKKMGEFLGMNQKSGSTFLSLLRKNGVLDCVNETYAFGNGKIGKAKTYRVRGNY